MFRFIPTSFSGIRTTFGKFDKKLAPGLTFYVPFFQKINLISNRTWQNMVGFRIKTSDNTFCSLTVAIQIRVKEDDSEKAYYSMGEPDKQINSYVENSIRSIVSNVTLNELYKSHNSICEDVLRNISERMIAKGYTIENTLITEITPDKVVQDSLNNIEASKRDKEAAEQKAEAAYITAIRDAEAEKRKKILYGEGISGQRKAIVDGYKEVVEKLSGDLGMKPDQIMEFVLNIQKLETLEKIGTSPNAKTLFLDQGAESLTRNILKATESKPE